MVGFLLFFIPAWLFVNHYSSSPVKISNMEVMCFADKFYNPSGPVVSQPHIGNIYSVLGIHQREGFDYYELAGFPNTAWYVGDFVWLSDLDEKTMQKTSDYDYE